MEKKRNISIDIVRVFLLLTVVIGHSQSPANNFIYLFHMPLFFVISGFLWNDSEQRKFSLFLKRKVLSLYIPYILFNFLILNIQFFLPYIFEDKIDTPSISTYFLRCIKIILFQGRNSISNATWFFEVLFLIVVSFYFINKFLKKYCNNFLSYSHIFLLMIFFMTGKLLYDYNFNYYMIGTFFSSYGTFIIGVLLSKIKGYIPHINSLLSNIILFNFTAILLVVFAYGLNIKINLYDNIVCNFALYFLLIVLGLIMSFSFANIVLKTKRFAIFFSKISKSATYIISLHLLFFKLLDLFIAKLIIKDMSRVAIYPVMMKDSCWWMLYSFVGVIFPILVYFLVRFIIKEWKVLIIYGKFKNEKNDC